MIANRKASMVISEKLVPAETAAERIEPTWVICRSCACSFECYKPAEEITDMEMCGHEDCSGEPDAWTYNLY